MPLRPISITIAGPLKGGYWTDEEMYDHRHFQPLFTTGDVSVFFFGKPIDWMNYQINRVTVWLDGEPLEVPRYLDGDRAFRLYDVERFAHGLFQGGRIGMVRFARAIEIVKLVAATWGYIDLPVVSDPGGTMGKDQDLTDDLNGAPGAEYHVITLDSVTVKIALTPGHFEQLNELLMPYFAKTSFVLKPDYASAREWAKSQGLRVGTHGPLPTAVMEAYQLHLDVPREE